MNHARASEFWTSRFWEHGTFSLAQTRGLVEDDRHDSPYYRLHILYQPSLKEGRRTILRLVGRDVSPGDEFNQLWENRPEVVKEAIFPRSLCGSDDWCIVESFSKGESLFCGACMEVYEGKVPELLREMPYAEYLLTTHWRLKREEAIAHYGDSCVLCGDGPVQVHHRTYERRGDELVSDLVVLCADCHRSYHRKAS